MNGFIRTIHHEVMEPVHALLKPEAFSLTSLWSGLGLTAENFFGDNINCYSTVSWVLLLYANALIARANSDKEAFDQTPSLSLFSTVKEKFQSVLKPHEDECIDESLMSFGRYTNTYLTKVIVTEPKILLCVEKLSTWAFDVYKGNPHLMTTLGEVDRNECDNAFN
ncbi:hypothetical protein J6590_008697 [Homalodisca vitripennis]|nr:hypothetical protein J6590_008697 [Homalodisca vitripennis]